MKYILSNANVFIEDKFVKSNVFINNGKITNISSNVPEKGSVVFDLEGCFIFPGLIDVHTHLREPGFFYKETIRTGTQAAAHGGYTTICAMPNLNPVPDCAETLAPQLDIIQRDACIEVLPYGAITKEERGMELADLDALAPHICAFSDDGRGVQNDEMMRQAMKKIRKLDKIVAAHCEVNELLHGGYIHDGAYCAAHGHKGICSESEWKQIERDLKLVRETGCKYHVCHISTKEGVALIRQAKKEGLSVSCETGPHYLVLTDMDLQEDGRFKMNPPIRSKEDQEALIAGILDGTIEMIATDHAPHTAEDKSKGLANSMMGIVGLETAFPILYTHLVKKGILTLEQLITLMHTNPAKRFGIGTPLAVGSPANLTIYNLDEKYQINPETFLSMGRSTPFTGWEVYGKCMMTMYQGNIVWQENLDSRKTTV